MINNISFGVLTCSVFITTQYLQQFNIILMCCYSYLCRQILKELIDLMNQDRSPLGNTRPQTILDPSIQRHLTHFSLMSHGFGSPTVVASLTSFQNYLNEMLKILDKNYAATQNSQNPIDSNGKSKVDNLKDENRRE